MADSWKELKQPVLQVSDDLGQYELRDSDGNAVVQSLVRKNVITLTDRAITFFDDPGVGAYGRIQLIDFPAGNIVVLGATLDATILMSEGWWLDNAAGDVGVGTTTTTDGTALDTTRQNIIPTTSVTMAAGQTGPVTGQSTAVLVTATAGTTDADAFLNIRIDDSALHFPDIVTNGAMTTDASWTKGTGWTIDAADSNTAASDGTQSAASSLSQTAASIEAGKTYTTSFVVTRSAGSVRLSVGGTLGTARSTANTFTEDIVAGTGTTLAIIADADFVGTVDTFTCIQKDGAATLNGTATLLWMNAGGF